jgi:hypothetical protein
MTRPGIRSSSSTGNTDLCPKCGNFTDSLDEVTGWCSCCASSNGSAANKHVSTKIELAFAANANAVEFYVSTSTERISVWQALTLARQDRPRCLVCGNELHRASRSAIFCRKSKECRYYSRRYVYLYTNKGLDKTQALAQIMNELQEGPIPRD